MLTVDVKGAVNKGMKIGKNVTFTETPNFGSEPYLIEIGDDVLFSFGITFVTHDASFFVINNIEKDKITNDYNYADNYGKIKIGNNVFVGCNTTILKGVNIGNNCIIGACSCVNKSIPDNCVAAGNPCKVICTIDEFISKHKGKHTDGKLLDFKKTGHNYGLDPLKMEYLKKKYNVLGREENETRQKNHSNNPL